MDKLNVTNTFDIGQVVGDDAHLAYLLKKTERIVKAIYIITNFFDSRDAIKWSLRDSSVKLLSRTVYLGQCPLDIRDKAIKDMLFAALESRTLLEMSHLGGSISTMNFNLLTAELDSLLEFVNSKYQSRYETAQSLSLGADFFTIKNEPKVDSPQKPIPTFNHMAISAGNVADFQAQLHRKIGLPASLVQLDDRKKRILGIAKAKKDFSIRDIAEKMTDCSEKTIQRELIEMVANGMLNKEGERRWSRYSVVV